jgi:DNA-binding SARP family transcriptional activator
MLALPAVARSPYVAVAGADESTFFAWLQGNDDALYRHRDMFGRLTLEYDVPGFWNVLAAFHGWPVQLTLSLDPINESRAALVLAADAPNDPAVAAARARRAVESADRASFALTQVKSRAVAAVLVPEAAQTFCEEAVAIAEKTDSPILRQAASAIAQGTPDATQHIQMIRLIGRVANDRGRQLPNKTLLLDLTTGEVTGAAGPIHLSSGALSLIVSLGVHAEPVSRAVLLESLWPDLDGDSASNALKMCVRRARAQLGGVDTVVNRLAGYALGERVHSNFQRIVALASMAYAGTFPEKTAMEAEHVFRRLIAGHRSAWARWEWFAPYARRLEDACRAIGYRLANDAIAGKDFVRALRIARDLIALEPLDEKPRQIAIQSLIGLKDRAAARREFEEFAALAEREGFSLSPQLRERAGS